MNFRELKVFSKEWFLFHQGTLLYLLNHKLLGKAIRETLEIKCELPIVKYLPNCYHWFDGEKFHAVFYTRNLLAQDLRQKWFYLWLMFHKWDMTINKLGLNKLNFGFDTLTVSPDANPETSTVDGYVRRGPVNESLATIIAGVGSSSGDSITTSNIQLMCSSTSNQFAYVTRSIFLFYTSTIVGMNISNAILRLYSQSLDVSIGTPAIHICSSSPVSNTGLAPGDYETMGDTSFSEISNAAWITPNYNDFTLNASGIANISSISKFGSKLSWDINNNSTGLTWSDGLGSFYKVYTADYGTSYAPQLVVTYSLPINLIPTNIQNIMTQIRM